MLQVPEAIKPAYEELAKAYEKYKHAEKEYIRSKQPVYLTIPQWFDNEGIRASFQDMQKMGFLAEQKTISRLITFGSFPIERTSIGSLHKFRQDILDECFEETTPKQ